MNKKDKLVPAIIILAILITATLIFYLRFFIGGDEDSWIVNKEGIWIKHGNPLETPNYVLEQQEAISCSSILYFQKKNEGMNFSSQCLGNCGNYSVDIVHIPRVSSEDDKTENQCADYLNGVTRYFIELDKNGAIVRIV
ncbi:Uncharacterised protein [uncultured archaeon]|nr:Uncharacterised protein [uncultured archaeon]